MLRAASARARGRLELLDVSDELHVTHDALVSVAAANAGTLRELRGVGYRTDGEPWVRQALNFDAVRRLAVAAPALRVLDVSVECDTSEELHDLLRCEPPFGAVRVREVLLRNYDTIPLVHDHDVWPLLAAAPALTSFQLSAELSHAALDALVDALVARRVGAVTFCCCEIEGAPGVAALARLVRDGALVELELMQEECLFEDADMLAPLCAALHDNTTLTELSLSHTRLWTSPREAAALLGALVAHPTLRVLNLDYTMGDSGWTAGAYMSDMADTAAPLLAALIEADAPALQSLSFKALWLPDSGVRDICAALRDNTHLTDLTWDVCDELEHAYGTNVEGEASDFVVKFVLNPTLRFFCPALRTLACQRWYVAKPPPRCALSPPPVRSRTPFDALPRAAVKRILRALPVDTRLRCLEVCTSFYIMLGAHRKVWTRVDLSPRSGIRVPPTYARLRAAVARACGKLQALDVSNCGAHISLQAVHDVWGADHHNEEDYDLRELRLSGCCTFEPDSLLDVPDSDFMLSTEDVPSTQQRQELWGVYDQNIVRGLKLVEIDIACESAEQASALLRGAPERLRVPRLTVACASAPLSEESAAALGAAAASHASLRELRLRGAATGAELISQAALHALAGACASRRGRRHLLRIVLDGCTVSDAVHADALATLLAANTELIIVDGGGSGAAVQPVQQ
jgi:hypothetical protein